MIRSVAIFGAGTMGGGIALTCAKAGLRTIVIDSTVAALDRLRSRKALVVFTSDHGESIGDGVHFHGTPRAIAPPEQRREPRQQRDPRDPRDPYDRPQRRPDPYDRYPAGDDLYERPPRNPGRPPAAAPGLPDRCRWPPHPARSAAK